MTVTAAQPNATGAPGYTAELPYVPESVSRARALVSSVLAAWCMEGDMADYGEVIVSELLTNAIDHTETPLPEVVIERRADSDKSRIVPRVKDATDDAECGRACAWSTH
ncbi:ATP-binding protein [Streptomyces sp. ok210]|uniref:ATP-binding protein n=1 Tax=Streptomyces sp. ok210 TaxID=1761905 RepID=UPI0008E55802|nr:ATP-binding protein [Streptomyces sp. ok210]SFT21458.1 Histidine kinase-like ATPase domain-containing protein [Streptomyces sp. ok210]